MRRLAVALAALLALSAAACGDTDPGGPTASSAAPSPSPSGYGTRYVLPVGLCEVADFTALLEVYPLQDGERAFEDALAQRVLKPVLVPA